MRKETKKGDGNGDEDREDRISLLAEDVLCHILSFLPSKEAIATSLLSKRWRFVWRVVPALDFDCTDQTTCDKVNMFLSLRTTQRITRFRLNDTGNHSMLHYDEWFAAANKGKLEHLNLNLRLCAETHRQLRPPLSCGTLVSLILMLEGRYFPRCVPVNLPSLKTLHLGADSCPNQVLKNFIYGSPALELFHLKQYEMIKELKIVRSARRIKLMERRVLELQLIIQSERDEYDFIPDYLEGRLENVVKAKAYFTVSGPNLMPKSINNHGGFGVCAFLKYLLPVQEQLRNVLPVLEQLRNVEFLSLADFRIIGWPSTLDLSQFQNLVQLRLYLKDANSVFKQLPANCPKLLRDSSSEPIIMDDGYDINKMCLYHDTSIVPI